MRGGTIFSDEGVSSSQMGRVISSATVSSEGHRASDCIPGPVKGVAGPAQNGFKDLCANTGHGHHHRPWRQQTDQHGPVHIPVLCPTRFQSSTWPLVKTRAWNINSDSGCCRAMGPEMAFCSNPGPDDTKALGSSSGSDQDIPGVSTSLEHPHGPSC